MKSMKMKDTKLKLSQGGKERYFYNLDNIFFLNWVLDT